MGPRGQLGGAARIARIQARLGRAIGYFQAKGTKAKAALSSSFVPMQPYPPLLALWIHSTSWTELELEIVSVHEVLMIEDWEIGEERGIPFEL